METTCSRCQQTVPPGVSFCPYCGLPQLVYSPDGLPEPGQSARRDQPAPDPGAVAWRPALRSSFLLAIPAGVAGAFFGIPGLLLMAVSGAWAVSLYLRARRPMWITVGAGARIGLAFGIIAAWLAFAGAGGALFLDRYAMHQGNQIDAEWRQNVALQEQFSEKLAGSFASLDTAEAQQQRKQTEAWMLSPEGHAGWMVAAFAFSSFIFVIFATLGGALGARMNVRRRASGSR